jgi:hypothetical protein
VKRNENVRVSYLCDLTLTVASIYHPASGLIAYGTALVGDGDQPSRKRGRAIALGRAQLVLSQALVDQVDGAPPSDLGFVPPTTRGWQKSRHAWVVRKADLDPQELMRNLRTDEDISQGWMLHDDLDLRLSGLAARRVMVLPPQEEPSPTK